MLWVDQMSETLYNRLLLRRGSVIERELCLMLLCNFTDRPCTRKLIQNFLF